MNSPNMSTEITKPSYWAVLPAAVRYDEELRPNAKLLYAEITALTNVRGYCWISNERLGEYFGISPKTVGSLIQQLAGRGYIKVELIRDEKQAITGRRLWIARPDGPCPPLLKNEDTPLKNEDTPILKNEDYTKTSKKTSPPIAPQGAGADYVPKKAPDWKPERFARFWDYYPLHKSKQAAIRAWDRLKPSDDLLKVIGIALRRQKAACLMAGDEWKLHASTYLNQARWTDESDLDGRGKPLPYGQDGRADREEALPWI